MRYAICYVSTAAKGLDKPAIEKLLKLAKENNTRKDIKGVLLYSEGNFFQVLEGEKEDLVELFGKIEKDPRHHTVIQVLGKEINQGSFDSYETDIITERNKYDPGLLEEYLETLKVMDPQTKNVVESILEVFIETRK